MDTLHIESKSIDDTLAIAKMCASMLDHGDVVLMKGDLSCGKTYFAKGIAEYYTDKDPVTSPTYSIANFYDCGDVTLLHIDLYRISSIEEFEDLGIADYFDESIVLIEWGEKLIPYLEDYLLLSFRKLDSGNEHRSIVFSSEGERSALLLKGLSDKLAYYKE